jgi:hypothetical protein
MFVFLNLHLQASYNRCKRVYDIQNTKSQQLISYHKNRALIGTTQLVSTANQNDSTPNFVRYPFS